MSLQKHSSSKPAYDFDMFSSSSKEEDEIKVDANTPSNQGNETETNPAENPTPFKPQDVNDGDDNDNKFKSSTLDTGSSDENNAHSFSLLELRDNLASVFSKVKSLDKYVAKLDSKLDQKLTSLDSKRELIFKSLSAVIETSPSELDRENQIDQLISL